MNRSTRRARVLTAGATAAMLLAACSSTSKSDTSAATTAAGAAATTAAAATTTAAAGGATTTAAAAGATTTAAASTTAAAAKKWAVDTSKCADPKRATTKITGTLKIGSVMPLSGGVAAIAFAPVADGFKAYFDYANEKNLVPGVKLEATIADDQYNKDLTPGAVEKLLGDGVNIFSGIIGSPNNLAVRDTLNEECVPQLEALTGSPAWGDVKGHPWTTGVLIPYDIESKIYAGDIKTAFPSGAKVAVFTVNSEFGQVYADAFKAIASSGGITIVDNQTIEATDENPPTAQVNSIASKKPDAIVAVPLGAGCPTFLKELVNAEAANPGWTPRVYLTNTCASSLILGIAGDAANGIFTSSAAKDIGNPDVRANDPKVKEFVDYMTSKGKGDTVDTSAAGWNTAEITVAILAQAAASPDGLTQASIIDAARNFTYTPSLSRDGVTDKMNGEADPFLAQSLQVVQYDATKKIFSDVGKLVTQYES